MPSTQKPNARANEKTKNKSRAFFSFHSSTRENGQEFLLYFPSLYLHKRNVFLCGSRAFLLATFIHLFGGKSVYICTVCIMLLLCVCTHLSAGLAVPYPRNAMFIERENIRQLLEPFWPTQLSI